MTDPDKPIEGEDPATGHSRGFVATPGRCVYCGERCEITATFHHFCRYEHETELAERNRYHPRGPAEEAGSSVADGDHQD